jgi:hypothetical protein
MSRAGQLISVLGLAALFALGGPGRVPARSSKTALSPVATSATGLSAIRRAARAPGGCPEASIAITPLPAGQARLELRSPCRADEEVQIRYASLEFFRRIDNAGGLDFIFDCIGGADKQVQLSFLDGSALRRIVPTHDLDRVTKVAAIWRGPVNLDLHAFEYAAKFGGPGHVWAGAPSSLAEAREASARDGHFHGFLSLQADGRAKGDQLEVYTLWRGGRRNGPRFSAAANSGIIALALDFESREAQPQDLETCGSGVFSEMAYKVIVREANGAIRRVNGAFSPLECGVKLHNSRRYNTKTIPYVK